MADTPDTETHYTSAEDAEAAVRRTSAWNALHCALLPGLCLAQAADTAAAAARTEASETSAALAAEAGSIGSGLGDAFRASAEPVSEVSSAVRYATVAATIITIAIVIAVLAVVVRTYV